MNLCSEPSLEGVHIAPPLRTVWILTVALVQGLACWCLSNNLLFAVLPPLVAAPVAFFVSERYLTRRPWLPSLLISLCWLPGLWYRYFVVGMVDSTEGVVLTTAAVYWIFCFFALPFIQTFAELGLRGLSAAELSARMNRNITLGLLGCLALMPVCLALGLGLGNINWDAWRDMGGRDWNDYIPYFIFSLAVPITFAGAVNWAQISMEKQAGTGQEWPVLPFLRKTIGIISGWVALVAGLAMVCILLSAVVVGGGHTTFGGTGFLRLMPAAFFWTACSMSVREGRWEDKARIFRVFLAACTLVFPFYMLWCAFGQWGASVPDTSFYGQRHHFWSWQNLSLGILLLASLGHGMAVCCRRWPEWASAVNVGVHLCILLLLIITRMPVADPLRYEADVKVSWLVANPQSNWYPYERLERDFGRYGLEALDRVLAQQGAEPGAQSAAEQGTEKISREAAWESIRARGREQLYNKKLADIRATFAAMPRLPEGAVVPESLLQWLAASEGYYYGDWLKPSEGQYFLLQDMDRDGEPEIILLNLKAHTGELLERDGEKGWKQIGSLDLTENIEQILSIATERPRLDDLVINGERIHFE